MEKELNIAEILKDKPQGTKLYDLLYNIDVELDTISTTDTEIVVWCTNKGKNYIACHLSYSEFGTVRGYPDGLQILLPSKEMRDWSKFAWKKGDVLTDEERFVIFKNFDTDDYTEFTASFEYKDGACRRNLWLFTNDFRKVPDNIAQEIIKKVEKHYGGKLNLETLEIEKQPEFKDGDILSTPSSFSEGNYVFIFKEYDNQNSLGYYVAVDNALDNLYFSDSSPWCSKDEAVRYATEEEKQRLFEALAKEGKAWDAEKKQIIDLKTKVEELKPFDKVLVKDDYYGSWKPALFWKIVDVADLHPYIVVGGNRYRYCEPYEGNESLLDY